MWALEADTVEYGGEYLTGVRIEGLTYSLFSFTRKCWRAMAVYSAFILGLDGYIANRARTPEVVPVSGCISRSYRAALCYWLLLLFGFCSNG